MGSVPEGAGRVRIVVCDTGPILHLHETGALELLAKAGEVFVPPSVDRELANQIAGWPDARPGWIQRGHLTEDDVRQAMQWQSIGGLGAGEAEAIALARALRADWLLTDDAGARVVASLLGLEVHGALGIILWAAASGHVHREESFAMLDRLAASSLWISARILNEAREALHRLSP